MKSYQDFMNRFFEEKKGEETQYHPIDKQKFETFLGKESKARELDLNEHILKSLKYLERAGRLEGKEGEENRKHILASPPHAKTLSSGLEKLDRDRFKNKLYSNSDYQLLLEHPEFAFDIACIYSALKEDNVFDDNARQLLAANLQYVAWIKAQIYRQMGFTQERFNRLNSDSLGALVALAKTATDREYHLTQLKQNLQKTHLSKEEQNQLFNAASSDGVSDFLIYRFCAELKELNDAKYFEGNEGKKFREAIFKNSSYRKDFASFRALANEGFFEGQVGTELRALLVEEPQLAYSVYKIFDFSRRIGFLEEKDQQRRIYQQIKENIRYSDNIYGGYSHLYEAMQKPEEKPALKKYLDLLFDNPQHAHSLGMAIATLYRDGFHKKKEWEIYLKLFLENQANASDLSLCIWDLENKGSDLFKNESDRTRNLTLLAKNAPFSTGLYQVLWRLLDAGLLRGAEGQENFDTLMKYAAAHHAIDEAMQNTVPTQEGFDMVMEKLAHEHNTQRITLLIAFLRATEESDIKYSVLHLIDTNSDLLGTRDQKGLQEQVERKSAQKRQP